MTSRSRKDSGVSNQLKALIKTHEDLGKIKKTMLLWPSEFDELGESLQATMSKFEDSIKKCRDNLESQDKLPEPKSAGSRVRGGDIERLK